MSYDSFNVPAGASNNPPGGTSNFSVMLDGYDDSVDCPATFTKVPWANNGVVTMAGKYVNKLTLRLYFDGLSDWVTLKKNTGFVGTLTYWEGTLSAELKNVSGDVAHVSLVQEAVAEFWVVGS